MKKKFVGVSASENRIRVLVNAGVLKNLATGIGRYVRELYSGMEQLGPGMEIRYFDGIRILEKMPVSPGEKGAWARLVNAAWQMPPSMVFAARALAYELGSRQFRRVCRGFDVYHEPGYFPYPVPDGVKTVFTVHDISLKTMPHFHPKDRVMFFRKYFDKALMQADAIITPSEFTKTELKKHYPGLGAEIYPVALGCRRSLFYPQSKNKIVEFLACRGLPDKYVLFVGTSDPRKNIQSILKALKYLPKQVPVICTGWTGWGDDLKELAKASGLAERVFFTGYVSDKELVLLYCGAQVFVYPSFYEGFGLPVIEAMACGCPVVCADAGSLSEVAGNAALYFHPGDTAGLVRILSQVLASDDLRASMRCNGFNQAAKFDWDSAAEKTARVFFHG